MFNNIFVYHLFLCLWLFFYIFCFDMNVLTCLVYYCVCGLPYLWICTNLFIFILILMDIYTFLFNSFWDVIYLFRFCIGSCLIFMYKQITYLSRKFIYKIFFLIIYKLCIHNMHVFENRCYYIFASILAKRPVRVETYQKGKKVVPFRKYWGYKNNLFPEKLSPASLFPQRQPNN